MEFIVCQRHNNYGCPFLGVSHWWACPTGGCGNQVQPFDRVWPRAKATAAPSDGHGSYCIIMVRICGGTKLCS